MPDVHVTGLTRTYGPTRAVDEIDFEIEVGEVVAILGPNGAGKTTAVEIIEGFRRPDAGEIEVLGGNPAQLYTRPKTVEWTISAVGLGEKRDARIKILPGASVAVSISPLRSWAIPSCCSWTSRPPGSTRQPDVDHGRR